MMTKMKMMQLCFSIHSGEKVCNLHDTLVVWLMKMKMTHKFSHCVFVALVRNMAPCAHGSDKNDNGCF